VDSGNPGVLNQPHKPFPPRCFPARRISGRRGITGRLSNAREAAGLHRGPEPAGNKEMDIHGDVIASESGANPYALHIGSMWFSRGRGGGRGRGAGRGLPGRVVMERPVFLLVSDDGPRLAALQQDLRRRYEADYQVSTAVSAAAALSALAVHADSEAG